MQCLAADRKLTGALPHLRAMPVRRPLNRRDYPA